MGSGLATNIRIAAEEATFGQNFAKVGLFPDYGGTYFLPQLVGPAKAAELFYTGDMIDAKIAQGPLLAIRAVKQALFASQEKELARALDNEVREQIRCYLSEDCNEGIG